jgi:hypothetical protein
MPTGVTATEYFRAQALREAVTVVTAGGVLPSEASLARIPVLTEQYFALLTGRKIVLRADPVTYEQGKPVLRDLTRYTSGGHLQLTDSQQVLLAAQAQDAKGFADPDTLTWSEDSGGAVVQLQPSADGGSCLVVAQAPGSATVKADDGTINGSLAVDVTPAGVASIVITPGVAEEQPAPAPEPPAVP